MWEQSDQSLINLVIIFRVPIFLFAAAAPAPVAAAAAVHAGVPSAVEDEVVVILKGRTPPAVGGLNLGAILENIMLGYMSEKLLA